MSRPSNKKVGIVLAGTILTIAVIIGLSNQDNGLLGGRQPTLVVNPNPVVRNQPYTLTGFNFQKYKQVKLVFSDDNFTTVVNPTRGGFKYLTNTQTLENQFTIYAYDATPGSAGLLLAMVGSSQ